MTDEKKYLVQFNNGYERTVITRHKKGFAVSMQDLESGNWLPIVKIISDFDLAIKDAKEKIFYE